MRSDGFRLPVPPPPPPRTLKNMVSPWGGASQASADFFPQVGQEVLEDAESRADARLVARENTFQAPDEFEDELQLHVEGALDLETGESDSRLQKARKRRLLPGADSAMSNFRDSSTAFTRPLTFAWRKCLV